MNYRKKGRRKLEKFIDHIYSTLTKNQDLSEDTLASIYYSLEVIMNTIVKLLVTMLVFIVWGQVDMFFYILFFTITTRTFIGGVHFDSFMGCSLFTTIFFILISYLANTFILSISMSLAVFTLAIIVFFLYAPVISINRPPYSKRIHTRFKRLSLLFTVLYLILFLIFKNSDFTQVILWGMFLSTIQLLIGKEVNRYHEKKNVQIQ
jgi:accessory gene regulator B